MGVWRRALWATLVAAALALGGCGAADKAAIASAIKTGMSTGEVRKAAGKPSAVESAEVLGVRQEVWTYEASDGVLKIQFVNDKVVMVGTR